jgi:hypothetical protein
MPKGEHLDSRHQSAAALANIKPRAPRGAKKIAGAPPPPDAPAKDHESYEAKMADATLRLQQSRAATESLDAEKRQVELDVLRRKLMPVADVVDTIEQSHLRWIAELEQLSTAVCTAVRQLPASLVETVRSAINAEVHAIRERIGGGLGELRNIR